MRVSPLRPPLDGIANRLVEVGAVKFGAFRLKLHRPPHGNPNAPLSPHYFDYRTQEHPIESKRGPVPLDLVEQIAAVMALEMADWRLSNMAIAAVPHGAVPYGRAVANLLGMPFIQLRKEEYGDSTTKVVGIEVTPVPRGSMVVLIEDVVTSGASSMEAIDVLHRAGMNVPKVFAVMDREQGGAFMIAGALYAEFHALFTYTTLMDHLLSLGDDNILSRAKYDESRAYHLASKSARP